jgi:hypothetical protein
MASGVQHYTAAQSLLEDIDYSQPEDSLLVAAHAQVHATLALAAELAVSNLGRHGHQSAEWAKAVSA